VIRDLTKNDWLEILKLDASHIPEALLLRGTRNLKRHYDAHLPRFDVVAQIGTPNGVLEDVFVGKYDGVTIGYASVYGAVAEHFGMERASILFGFDNPRQKEHMLLSDAEKDARRGRANAAMIELALIAIRSYCGHGERPA